MLYIRRKVYGIEQASMIKMKKIHNKIEKKKLSNFKCIFLETMFFQMDNDISSYNWRIVLKFWTYMQKSNSFLLTDFVGNINVKNIIETFVSKIVKKI